MMNFKGAAVYSLANELILDNVNITYERIFREQVEEFLTNGNYKFFKSPTEGVKIISVMNIERL